MKKRLYAGILVIALALSALAGCGGNGSPSGEPGNGGGPGASGKSGETTFGIEPFDQRQTLRVGYFAGSALSVPFYIADKEGFWDELNIDIEYETFTNGPAMMEANSDWDVAGAGSAGVLVGMIGYDTPLIGICDYEKNQALFVRADSPLAADPENPENWKGTTWLYPSGTTAHFTLATMLKKVGLTTADITSVNMDVSSALNAFIGGEGDGFACWNAFAFMAEDNGFVRIADAGSLNITNASGTVATKDALQNKRELVTKAWAVFYRTWEWCGESDENMEKAIEYYLENCEEEGVAVDESVGRRIMEYFLCPAFDESAGLMTDTAPDAQGLYTDRELLQAEIDLLVTMDFFVEQGRYQPADRERVLRENLVDPSIAKEAKELYGK